MRGATQAAQAPDGGQDFNPRSPCGERLQLVHFFTVTAQFQSTLPMRGATTSKRWCRRIRWISIHAPHAGSDCSGLVSGPKRRISIHAPHAGSDRVPGPGGTVQHDFNPRSPCGERPVKAGTLTADALFQSTLPMRGATNGSWFTGIPTRDFNPRSPCGERPEVPKWTLIGGAISIHAPHAGSDMQFTAVVTSFEISIHAPHAGSDDLLRRFYCPRTYFNPRSPCGERHPSWPPWAGPSKFQSTLPMRGATRTHPQTGFGGVISIHAPHAGSDPIERSSWPSTKNFNPRSPCGERPGFTADVIKAARISIHAPHAGSDGNLEHRIYFYRYFNPRSPCGERLPK